MSNARIKEFLAQGMTPQQVLSVVGCQPAYLNSLLKNEEFMKEVAEAAKPYMEAANEEEIISNKHLSLEHKILQRIEALLPGSDIREATRTLEVVGSRQDKIANRKAGYNPSAAGLTEIRVTLNIPAHAIPEYTVNSASEITTIENKPMSPMPSGAVKSLFDKKVLEAQDA